MIDPRVIRVGVEVDGEFRFYEDLDIKVSGSKTANALQNTCEITISNLTRDTRNFILTETSPFNANRTPKRVVIEIGRKGVLVPGATVTPVSTGSAFVVGPAVGLVEPGNINLNNRPSVTNPDGTISTVRSLSIGEDDREVLIPTVSQDGRLLSDDEAVALYQETGQHLGKFATEQDATIYAEQLHNAQAAQYAPQTATVGGWVNRVFVGEITASSPSQPPDIALTIKAKTSNFAMGDIVSRSGAAQDRLSSIALRVAADLSLTLDFQATDKVVANYSFTGPALKQTNALELIGGVDVFVDDDTLVVKDTGRPLRESTRVLSQDSGMIGVPEATERGVKVTMLFDKDTVLGGALEIESRLNPALSGAYTIYQLDFDAETRGQPFYWLAYASRNGYTPPKQGAD